MIATMIALVDSREIIGNTPIYALTYEQFIKESKRQNKIMTFNEFTSKFNNCLLNPKHVSILFIDKKP